MQRVLAPVSPSAQPNGQFPQAPKALNRSAAELGTTSASADTAAPGSSLGPTELVVRPTGLRHGRWEAPEWAFWTIGAVVVLLSAVYVLTRLASRKRLG